MATATTPQPQAQRINGAARENQYEPPATLLDKIISQGVASPTELVSLQIENDNLVAAAAARPVSHRELLADIKAQLEAYPSFAREAIYYKPVGRGDDNKQKYARGLSIRAAEAVAVALRYNRVRTCTMPLDENTVMVEATFISYGLGGVQIWTSKGPLSKRFKTKSGAIQTIADDRFYGLVVKAEESRRIREAILRTVPPGLKTELLEIAERSLQQLLNPDEVSRIVNGFSKFKVTLEQIESRLGRLQKDWTQEDRVMLLGLYNALKDGETTADEAFGAEAAESGQKKTSAAELTGKAPKAQPATPAQQPVKEEAGKPAEGYIDPGEVASPEKLERIEQLRAQLKLSAGELTRLIKSQGCTGIPDLTEVAAIKIVQVLEARVVAKEPE